MGTFLNYVNNVHPEHKFSNETEFDNNNNFLDLTISYLNNKFTLNMFI